MGIWTEALKVQEVAKHMLGIHLLCAWVLATVTQRSVRDGHTSNHLEVICSYLCDLLIPSDIETHKREEDQKIADASICQFESELALKFSLKSIK